MKNRIKLLTSHSIWFTGYPSSGKTTIANFIKKYLINRNLKNTIETIAFGENKLLVKTSDEIKEKQNRRAELYLK